MSAFDSILLEIEAGTPGITQRAKTKPLAAIRMFCITCTGGSKADVRKCESSNCPLHPFRMGKGPARPMSEEQKATAAARLRSYREAAE